MAEAEVFNFSLERDDHLNCLVSKLNFMFEEGKFVDFALAAADGRLLKVHRVILCTFSRYFEDLLEKRPENYAFVMLKTVNFEDLKALVEYMYKGTVSVSQQQVPSFLKAALLLKIAGLPIHQSNLEVDTDHSDDIGFIQARPEEQGPMIQPEHDPKDIISVPTSSIVAEPPLQMREEDKEETMVLVEEVTGECDVFRDGFLCVDKATPFSVRLDSNGRASIPPMDDVDEKGSHCKDDSENPQRTTMKDKEDEDESDLGKEGTNAEVESESAQFSYQKNKDSISSADEEQLPYSYSTTTTDAQTNQKPKKLKIAGSLLTTTVLGITKGIQMIIPEQLGEDWMDTSVEENVQGNDEDVSSKAMNISSIQNVKCNAQSFDTGELQDASSSTVQKPKEGENAKTIMMNCQEDAKGGDESELGQFSSEKNKDTISSDDEEELSYSSSISPLNDVLFLSIIDQETVIKVSMQIPEEFGEDWMDTSDDGNELGKAK